MHEYRTKKLSMLATAGLGVIEGILNGDIEAKAPARLDAAKLALSLAGHVAPKASEPEPTDEKPLETMTIPELEAFIRRGEASIAAAKAPTLDGETGEPIAPDIVPVELETVETAGVSAGHQPA